MDHPNQPLSFCMYCGTKYESVDLFCKTCGRKLQEDEPISKEEQNQRLYERALELLELKNFATALPIFTQLAEYKDSQEKANLCILGKETAIQEHTYRVAVAVLGKEIVCDSELKSAIESLQSISNYQDAKEKIADLEARLEAWYAAKATAEKEEQIRITKKKAKCKKVFLFSILGILLAGLIALGILLVNMQYKIAYDYDGGTVVSGNVRTYKLLTDDFTINNPSKEGYTFIGWTGTGLDTPTETVTIRKGEFGYRTYTANWQANEYVITFDANGGTLDVKTQNVTFNAPVKLPSPTREGYTFAGWYVGDTQYESGDWKDTKDLTLTARWSAKAYKITLNDIYNHSSSSFNYVSGSAITYNIMYGQKFMLPVPNRTGHEFLGWYDGDTKVEADHMIVTSDFSLTPKWEAKSYAITLDANGGTISSSRLPVTYGKVYYLPTPTRDGYTFDDWYSGTTRVYSGTWSRTSDLSLVAKWTPKNYQITLDDTRENRSSFLVTLNHNYRDFNGTPTSTLTLNNGQTFEYPEIPERSGYAFGGWYTDQNCRTMYDFNTPITSDITLYAKWYFSYNLFHPGKSYDFRITGGRGIQYISFVPLVSETITVYTTGDFDTVGYLFDSSKTQQLAYNNDNGNDCNFSYTYQVTAGTQYYIGLNGISESSSGRTTVHITGTLMPTSTATAMGSDNPGFFYDTDSVATLNVTYDSSVTLPTPTREEYTFVGWYYGETKVESPTWSIASNVTLTPRWEQQ